MVTLYITRHGETEWNTQKRMQGWQDSDLTATGKKNAVALGERVKNIHFDAIFSSPTGRTVATTNLIRRNRDIPVIYDDNLKEMNMGIWEGKTLQSIEETYPSEFKSFWNTPHLYRPIDGETFEETRERAIQLLHRIRNEYRTGHLLLVTHSVLIKCLFSIFKSTPIEALWVPPFIHDTSLSIVEVNGTDYKIILEGDLSHREPTKI